MPPEPLRRPDLDVVARMLESLVQRGGAAPRAKFQNAAGLNYEAYQRYMAWMASKGLVHLVEGKDGPEVRLSAKGLELYHALVDKVRRLLGEGLR